MGLSHPRFVNWAAQDGRVDDLVYHLQRAGTDSLKPSSLSPRKRAPIHLAAVAGHSQCLKVLFDAGSSLEVRDKDGHSALHLAASNQHYHTVQLLLSLGAKPNPKTRFHVTPLHLATSVGNTPCVELLLSGGALINAHESWGQTPLAIATQGGRLTTMCSLLQHGADPEICDFQHSQTALHIACASKDESRVLILLDAGCNVHATDGQGRTPLGVAIINRFYRVVPLLLEYGATLSGTERPNTGLPLLHHLDKETRGGPLSLSRQCRVAVRRMLGPSRLAGPSPTLATLNLPAHVLGYLKSVCEVCEGEEVRQRAVEGVTIVNPLMVER